MTGEAQLRILEKTNCKFYLRPAEMAGPVDAILQGASHVEQITVPGSEEFLKDDEAPPVVYSKSWDEGKDDPWLVFHTSGTTGSYIYVDPNSLSPIVEAILTSLTIGNPKPITYTQEMIAYVDAVASLPDIEESHIHQHAQRRWYTPLPSLHVSSHLSNR